MLWPLSAAVTFLSVAAFLFNLKTSFLTQRESNQTKILEKILGNPSKSQKILKNMFPNGLLRVKRRFLWKKHSKNESFQTFRWIFLLRFWFWEHCSQTWNSIPKVRKTISNVGNNIPRSWQSIPKVGKKIPYHSQNFKFFTLHLKFLRAK